ncbi:MAG: hypothetical protein JWN78_2430 [Bacteroidota bacterium]|nr:hypothetical protein [Bacteroidota bacterium]
MKNKISIQLVTLLCFFSSIVMANKTFIFTYDANGNRVTLTYSSTCRVAHQDTTKTIVDTTAKTIVDSTLLPDQKILSQLQTVDAPKIYPNLVRTDFLISLPMDITSGRLEIYDMYGYKVYTENNITTSNTIVSTCTLPAGVYNVIFYYGDNKSCAQKIIKQ